MFAFYTSCVTMYKDFIPKHSEKIDNLYRSLYRSEPGKWPRPAKTLGIVRFYYKNTEVSSDALIKSILATKSEDDIIISFSQKGIEVPDSVYINIDLN